MIPKFTVMNYYRVGDFGILKIIFNHQIIYIRKQYSVKSSIIYKKNQFNSKKS